jgi:hypothetical protein
MKKHVLIFAAFALTILLAASPALAEKKHHGGSGPIDRAAW